MVGDASKQNWQVPVHEMGHAIEYTLGLQNSSDDVFKKIAQNKYEPKNSREYFAWSTQDWFGCRKTRSEMHLLARTYFRTRIFNNQNTWMPKCTP
jgi:hypothetical protein